MARLAADKIAERRNRAASPRAHVDGCVAGGRLEVMGMGIDYFSNGKIAESWA
jgi:hypothetical protein